MELSIAIIVGSIAVIFLVALLSAMFWIDTNNKKLEKRIKAAVTLEAAYASRKINHQKMLDAVVDDYNFQLKEMFDHK